jgi:hypothetical protein
MRKRTGLFVAPEGKRQQSLSTPLSLSTVSEHHTMVREFWGVS